MERLVEVALVGTGRSGDKLATPSTPTAALVDDLPELTPARRVLLSAGAQAIYIQAGKPIGPVVPPGAEAPSDALSACSPAATHILDQLLTRDEHGVLPEALTRLAQARLRLPHRLIVAALDVGKREATLRPLVSPVLDQRGQWLAGQNPDWAWVAGTRIAETTELPDDAETLWQEGTPAERLAILERLREHDPAKGRDWVAETWKSEKAEFRADCVAGLLTGLSPADEPFLEAALDDRSKAVKSQASQLLVQLRESALSARMRERADALLSYTPHKRSLIRSLTQAINSNAARGELAITLPEKLEKDWQRDGIEAKPRPGLGERAWWLICILSTVPPRHWTTRFAATPAELIAAAIPQEWGQVTIEGWTWAAIAAREEDWILPLWRYWQGVYGRRERNRLPLTELLQRLVAVMPQAQLIQVGNELLDDATRTEESLWIDIAPQLPSPWPVAWGQRYLEISRERLRGLRPQRYDPWIATFAIAAKALPPETFPLVAREWQGPSQESGVTYGWQRQINTLTDTVALRQRLIKEIPL